ncbi:SGNH/GDSL hydrolase family protein [Nostoc parmelioides]|uniref:Lipolytic protein n=1 Tax=Nostoc parmelioides FACHB-3921 TaxID=2692909 RepID=A0ABR8BGN9_9NOSO|nr:SGNH/GDSL hydrolase family protein [Nostoc parmelioides]MBD2252991.1 lipolytic protein [Nostoc parmelioides FACHB-3921]
MKTKFIGASLITLSLMSPLKASAANFTGIYVFGDSLSDTGNTFQLSGGLVDPLNAVPPSPPYEPGRFSNGSIWVDYVGNKLGLTPTPITNLLPDLNVSRPLTTPFPTQGINFAIGGANSGQGNSFGFPLPGVLEQVSAFQALLQVNQQSLDPNALYTVSGGANDYLFPPQSSDPNRPQPYTNISQAVSNLAAIGAKNILVFNLPDLGKIPASGTNGRNPAMLTQATLDFNSNLAKNLDEIRKNQQVNIIEIDIYSLVNRVLDTPSEFGFENVTNSCLSQFLNCRNNPSQYFFWDDVHPTTDGHQLVAESVLAATTPESSTTVGILFLGALGAMSSIKSLQRKSIKSSI